MEIQQQPTRRVIGVICGAEYLMVKMPVSYCQTCERRRRMLLRVEAWRGGYWTCLTCGENYHSEEGRMQRPFSRGWRPETVRQAKEFWARYGRVELTYRRIKELFGE